MIEIILQRVGKFLGPNYKLSVCRKCPKLTQPNDICSECGCFMQAKTKIPGMHCPLKYW
jgi:ribosomal protein L32